MNSLLRGKLGVIVYVLPVFWLLLVVLALNITSPLLVGPAGILVIFCVFYGFVASLFYVVLLLLNKAINKFYHRKVSNKRLYLLSLIFALAPIFMVALNSLGQLGMIELVLIGVLVGLVSFYVARRYEIQAE